MINVVEVIYFITLIVNLKDYAYDIAHAINSVERLLLFISMFISILGFSIMVQVSEMYELLVVVAIIFFNKGLMQIIRIYRTEKIVDVIEESIKKIKK